MSLRSIMDGVAPHFEKGGKFHAHYIHPVIRPAAPLMFGMGWT